MQVRQSAEVGLPGPAEAAFGIGVLCWTLLGSTILNRLFFHSALPDAFIPTLAIEPAPPSVAGIAYFAITDVIHGKLLPPRALPSQSPVPPVARIPEGSSR